MRRQKRTKTILTITIAAILLAAALAILGWRLGWFGRSTIQLSIGLPGSASESSSAFSLDQSVAKAMQQRMLKLLETDDGEGIASWYQLAGKYGKPAAERSSAHYASDQLRYGLYLLEQGGKKSFEIWWADFRAGYRSDDGLICNEPVTSEKADLQTGDFLRNNQATLRLLAQSCSIWPDRQRRSDLLQLSDKLLGLFSSGIPADLSANLPTPVPTLDPAATPTPKPTATPTPGSSPHQVLSVLRLASPDLYVMKQMALLDARWQTLYNQHLKVVQAGYLSDELPLYALGYDGQDGYLTYAGDSPAINTEEACLTVLRLCEVGQENSRSLSWIKDQLYNNRKLYVSYHITQGTAMSNEECVPAYAIVARIARIKGDADLYRAAVDRLMWHQATNTKSDALDALFRQDSSGNIQVRADDNTWALLAIR